MGVMARHAPQITLSEQERSELRRRAACYTLPHIVVQRAKLALYAADGLTNIEIAARLDMAADVVGRWRSRFARERLERVLRIERGRVARAVFPPQQIAEVKAIACQLPAELGAPLSRFSRAELHRLVVERAVCAASASTIARWLSEDAIRPWQHRSWIFPRDPDFLQKAAPVLDLYERRWQGELLHPGDFVLCADEKTQIQARRRDSPTTAARRGARSASSTTTTAAARCVTWPPGTCTAA